MINASMQACAATLKLFGGLLELPCDNLDLDLHPHHFAETYRHESLFGV